jgi:hypothetical protein
MTAACSHSQRVVVGGRLDRAPVRVGAETVEQQLEVPAGHGRAERPVGVREPAEHHDQQRHVGRPEVGAQGALGLRPLDELGERRLDPGAQPREPAVVVADGVEELVQAAVVGLLQDAAAQELAQRVPCRRQPRAFGQQFDPGLDPALEHRFQQRGLRREPPVHGADADPRAGRDLLQGGVDPALGENPLGRGQHPLQVELGVAARGARGGGRHARRVARPG